MFFGEGITLFDHPPPTPAIASRSGEAGGLVPSRQGRGHLYIVSLFILMLN